MPFPRKYPKKRTQLHFFQFHRKVLFKYTNTSTAIDERSRIPNNNCELVFNLYSIRDNNIYNMMYSGKTENGTLYGKSLDRVLGDITMATEQQRFLTNVMSNDKTLGHMNLKRFRNQEVIQWWYDYNPPINGAIKFHCLLPDNTARYIWNKTCRDFIMRGKHNISGVFCKWRIAQTKTQPRDKKTTGLT